MNMRSSRRPQAEHREASLGLGRTYFFLLELDLLELDLAALLFALELLLFFEPELVLDFAMITPLCGRQNRRDQITVPIP